jgi:hypothetical protein
MIGSYPSFLTLSVHACGSMAPQKLLNNPEIQHRLLEEMPLLGAIPGFKAVTGRRLSNEAVSPLARVCLALFAWSM